MKFRVSLLAVFLFFATLSFGQDPYVDSLKQALKIAKHDTSRCYVLSYLAESASDEEWPVFNEQLRIISEKNIATAPTKELKKIYLYYYANALNNIAYLAEQQGDNKKALEYNLKSLKINEEIDSKSGIANSLNNIGAVYDNQGDIIKALEYYQKSIEIRKELNDQRSLAYAFNNIGTVYDNLGDAPKALSHYLKSLNISEKINDHLGIAGSLNNIAEIYSRNGEIEKALEFNFRSLKISEKYNEKKAIGFSLTNIGIIYDSQNKFDLALEYYEKSLKIKEGIQDKQGIALSYNNIGTVYRAKHDLPKALEYLEKSLALHEETENKAGTVNALVNIAAIHLNSGRPAEGLVYGKRALQLANELGYPKSIKGAANILSRIYGSQRKFKEAYEMYDLEVRTDESINNAKSKKAAIQSQFKYQYEKQAAQDSIAHLKETDIKNIAIQKQELELETKRKTQYALYGGLVLVLVFSGVMFNRFKVTQKQKTVIELKEKETQHQKMIIEEKQKEIVDSINYAKRIQIAQMPSEKYVARNLTRLQKN
ncbi:MAG: tetratricopeptide repeat protein [Bacteroidia bacterium]|nr:tetratricopeptide repeat protein [Bacteroidia bacterium]